MAIDPTIKVTQLSADQIKTLNDQIELLQGASQAIEGMKKMGLNTTDHENIVNPLLTLAQSMKAKFTPNS